MVLTPTTMAPRTSVKAQHSFGADYDCGRCDYKARATVTATGYGDEAGWPDTAEEGARTKAFEDAVAVATRTLWFVPCPRCGFTNPRGLQFKIKSILGALVIGCISGAICFAFMNDRGDELLATGFGIGTGLLFTAIFLWRWGRAWVGARARVLLEE
ncbi:MAG: hypothetical protein QM817_33900 [Archangium sp.]